MRMDPSNPSRTKANPTGAKARQPSSESSLPDEFARARRRAFVQDIMAPLRGAPADLLPFEELREKLRLQSRVYCGLQDVPLRQIVSSVERYTDFTRAFLPRYQVSRERWQRLSSLRGRLPPVDLYKVGDAYCVVDGNHRVSVARHAGARTIRAQVWEYQTRVPVEPETTLDDLLAKEEYLEFLEHTRLDESRPEQPIVLTALGGYRELEGQIAVLQAALSQIDARPFSYEEAATYWYDMIYTAVLQIIREKDMLRDFPGRTEADLFVWVSSHQRELSEAYGYTVMMSDAADQVKGRSGSKWVRRSLFALKKRLLGPSSRRRSGGRM